MPDQVWILYAFPAINGTATFFPGIVYPKNGIPLPENIPIIIPVNGRITNKE